jgi:Domain of unknown function (DUF3291)
MTHHLAQFNIAKLVADFDSEQLRSFREAQDHLNALASAADGHIWHLKGEGESSAASFRPYGQDIIINLSVWRDFESLKSYTYSGQHLEYLRRRKEWFVPIKERYFVLWWVAAGHIPSIEEAMERLAHLQNHGSSDFAFLVNDPRPAPQP